MWIDGWHIWERKKQDEGQAGRGVLVFGLYLKSSWRWLGRHPRLVVGGTLGFGTYSGSGRTRSFDTWLI
jgi:hypothetical protein